MDYFIIRRCRSLCRSSCRSSFHVYVIVCVIKREWFEWYESNSHRISRIKRKQTLYIACLRVERAQYMERRIEIRKVDIG